MQTMAVVMTMTMTVTVALSGSADIYQKYTWQVPDKAGSFFQNLTMLTYLPLMIMFTRWMNNYYTGYPSIFH